MALFILTMVISQAKPGLCIFDLTINLGNILTIAAFLGGGIYFILAMRSKIDAQSMRMENMERDFTQMSAETQHEVRKITEVIILQGRHDERITALSMTQINQGKRLDDTIRRMNTYLDIKSIGKMEINDE